MTDVISSAATGYVVTAPAAQGPPGPSVVTRTAALAVSIGTALRASGSNVSPVIANPRTVPMGGLSISAGAQNATINVYVAGPVPPATFNLGAGVACAVGVKSDGTACRATNSLCVSAPNWVGDCDANGTITIAPRRAQNYNVLDYGAVADSDGSGTKTENQPAFAAAIARANADGPGAVIFVPRGRYQITGDVGALAESVHIRGDGYGVHATGSVLEFFGVVSGLWVWREYAANTAANVVVEDLSIVNFNSANHGGTVTDGTHSFYIQKATNATPISIVTDQDHGWTTGQSVTVAGVRGNTAANGARTITHAVVDSSSGRRTFTLNGSVGNGAHLPGGAGLEMGGGGEFLVRRCQFNGWQYDVICDGTNGAQIEECVFFGYIGSAIQDQIGVWCTDSNGERVTSAGTWAVPNNTNLVYLDKSYFNNPVTQVRSTGGVSHHVTRSLFNCSRGYTWDIEGTAVTSFEKNYFEGNTNSVPTPGVLRINGVKQLEVTLNFGAISGSPGAPFILGIGANNQGIGIERNSVSCGTAAGTIIGGATMTRIRVGPNMFANNNGGPLFDVDSGISFIDAACVRPDGDARYGFNTTKPALGWDYVDSSEGWGVRSKWGPQGELISHKYIHFSECSQLRRGLFSWGAGGTFNTGTTDGLAFIETAAADPLTSFLDTWVLPASSLVIVDVDVIGCNVGDQSKLCVFRKQLVITRASGAPTLRSTDDRNTPKNTDTFTVPTFTFNGSNNLVISVTSQAGYSVQWLAVVRGAMVAQ